MVHDEEIFLLRKQAHDMQQHIECLEQIIKDQDTNIRMLLNKIREHMTKGKQND